MRVAQKMAMRAAGNSLVDGGPACRFAAGPGRAGVAD